MGDEDVERRRGGMERRDGHREPGGQIMQRERLEGEMR